MINQLLIIFSTIFIYESVKYLRLINIIKSNLKIYKKIFSLLQSNKTSDFRREKLILNYSKSLLISSIKIIIIFIIILIFIFLINNLSSSFVNFATSLYGFTEISFIFFIYHKLRKKINAKL